MSVSPGATIIKEKAADNSSASDGNEKDKKFSWEWYDPSEDSVFVNFCNDTSLHGIQYMGQQGRHMIERIFWFLACLAAGIYGAFFIWRMWNDYLDMPIVTVFNPKEKTLAEIPFPAVTICNVNNIRRSRATEYYNDVLNISGTILSQEAYLKALAKVNDLNHICESKTTFAERFTPDIPQVERMIEIEFDIERNKRAVETYMNPTRTLRQGSQSCNQMLLFCLWLDEIRNCSDLFQEIETDFGICCTFNIIPMTVLKKFKYRGDLQDDPKRVKEWLDADLNSDNLILDEEENNSRKYPARQLYPGKSAGLSFLLDSDLHEYDCTNTDSEGFLTSVSVPLDVPRMRDKNGIAIPVNSEVFISIKPEVIMSDKSVHDYNLNKRRCYFEGEYDLPHYTKYTESNCMDECFAETTYRQCKCKQHYMPRGINESLCSGVKQHKCTDSVRKKIIQTGLRKECNFCLPTCSDIDYHTETNYLKLQDKVVANLWKQYPNLSFGNLSIVHVYMSVDAIYPRLRKEMTSAIDLLADAGGLLGFCMGFSILSVLEFVYHLTMRLFFQVYRNRQSKSKRGSFWGNYKQILIAGGILAVLIVATYYLRHFIVKSSSGNK